ncbi:MFS transporter [Chloroflexota bacterium]
MKGNAIKKFDFRSLITGLVPLFVVAHCAHHLLIALPVPMLPLIRDEFALDYTRSGMVYSAFALSYGFSQLPAGWLADRFGPRLLITIGICGVAAAGLLVGLSQTYIMLMVFLALMGVAGGGYHPAAIPLISAAVPPRKRGRVLGFHMIGGAASFFLSPLIAAGIAVAWGWRGPFIVLAVPSIVYGVIFSRFLGGLAHIKSAEPKTIESHIETPVAPGHWRRLVAFLILSVSNSVVIRSVVTFIPLFMVDHFGVAKETAAALLAVIYSAGLWSSPLGGYLSDRLGSVPVTLAVCFFAGPVVYLLGVVPYGLGIGAVLILFGMIHYIRQPSAESYIVTHGSQRHRSTVLGIYYFGAVEGAGIITPLIGYLADRFGFYVTFTIAGAFLLATTLVCSIWLWGSRD